MEKLIEALLTDENGISEQAYNALTEFLWDEIGKAEVKAHSYHKLIKMVKLADATDGRFYFSN